MGIPAFYRWLVTKYPLSVVEVLEEVPITLNGVKVPLDTSKPNPNGVEFDNLYLDMNGIIHPCFHPEGRPAPETYEEVFKAVFRYIDRIFSVVRPRKLLYMAIDGVAPRAKMNQQRSRRFRASKDAADAAAEEERLRRECEELLDSSEKTSTLDSNVITPGTEFMASLTSALQYYIHLKINSDPGWFGIKVILSDANVPGEGEHKIMSYIRLQRNLPGYDPNTRHCLYGLDADLIMLALATHEIHFAILREDVRMDHRDNNKRKRGECKKPSVIFMEELKREPEEANDYISDQNFVFLNIWVLREYLVHDMKIPGSPVKPDLERLIDDFVFMCVFVGNDFLPHVPSLDIVEGAIDLLMNVYKKEFVQMGGHLTNSYEVNLERVEHFLKLVGLNENAIFRRRSQVEIERRAIFKNVASVNRGGSFSRGKDWLVEKKKDLKDFWNSLEPISKTVYPTSGNSGAKEVQASIMAPASNGTITVVENCDSKKMGTLVKISTPSDATVAVVDNIKLGEDGWKKRYYAAKFEANTPVEMEKIRAHSVLKYIEGICWVMHYYYQGVCSWQWFYPYHYAPFASDFVGLERLEIHFTLGEPFKPLNQLMAVLPAASAHALPMLYRKLMTDSASPILDFYPEDFELDMNGKRFAWQAVCKLPFIKESRLLAEIAKVEHSLTDEEKRRNSLGLDGLFIHISHPLAEKVFSFCKHMKDHPKLSMGKVKRKINPSFSGGMNGYIYISDEPVWKPEISSPVEDMDIIEANKVISVFYKLPSLHPHIPRPPEGVVIPRKVVTKKDILPEGKLWHEKSSILGRIYSESAIPKSISGIRLGELSRQLIMEYYKNELKEIFSPPTRRPVQRNSERQQNRAAMELDSRVAAKHTAPFQTISRKKVDDQGPQNVATTTNTTNATPFETSSKETSSQKIMENGAGPESVRPVTLDRHDSTTRDSTPCKTGLKETVGEITGNNGERSYMKSRTKSEKRKRSERDDEGIKKMKLKKKKTTPLKEGLVS